MSYNLDTVCEKNMTLSLEFERYLLEHPDVLAEIPDGAEVVLLPKDDPELYQINLNSAQQAHSARESTPIVYIEIEALMPARSRLLNPQRLPFPTLHSTVA